MIVITGPGRSGTSALGALYDRLGFEPGGVWAAAVNAGYEPAEIVAVNNSIGHDLDMTMLGPARKPRSISLREGSLLQQIATNYQLHYRINTLPGRRARQLRLLDWDKLDATVAKHRANLRDLASGRRVAKDPRFIWTLPVWLAAGADVTHVVITTRSLDAALASRKANRLISYASDADARNALIFGVGLCVTTCLDHGIPYTMLRFPDFLADTQPLRRLPLVADCSDADFEAAVAEVVRPEMVHH